MKTRLLVILLCLLLFSFENVYAQSFVPGQGTTTSSTASINPERSWQFFINYTRANNGPADVSNSPTAGITYGLTKYCTVSVGFPYESVIGTPQALRGFEDMNFGFDFLLTPANQKLGALIGLGVKPQTTPNPALSGNGATDYSGVLALTYNPDSKWSFSGNYGWNHWGNTGVCPANNTPFYSFIAQYNLSAQFSGSLEYYGLNPQYVNTYSNTNYWDAALTYNINKNWNLQGEVAFGLNSQSTNQQYMLSVGYLTN